VTGLPTPANRQNADHQGATHRGRAAEAVVRGILVVGITGILALWLLVFRAGETPGGAAIN